METKTLLWRQAGDLGKDSVSYINSILVENDKDNKFVFDSLCVGIRRFTIWSRLLKTKNRWYPIAPSFSIAAEQFMKPNATTTKVLECFKNNTGEYMIGSRLSTDNGKYVELGFLFSSNNKDINGVCDDLEATLESLKFDYNRNDILAIRKLVPKYNRYEKITRIAAFILVLLITLLIIMLCN